MFFIGEKIQDVACARGVTTKQTNLLMETHVRTLAACICMTDTWWTISLLIHLHLYVAKLMIHGIYGYL